ncbi:MAG TPA: hypothetical protein VGL11_08870 [Candidatus Binatia bacterium]|jgi:hypothetical protein
MSDRDEKLQKLDAMLRSRRMEPAGPDLAQRIILKARDMPQSQTLPLTQWMKGLFAEFHLPKPAYVLAGTLMIGLVLGFNAPVDTTPDDLDSAQNFLYADEDVL